MWPFRHSSWRPDRERVYASFQRQAVGYRRRVSFAECGASYWMLASRTRPGVYKLTPDFCHDRFCVPCSKLRADAVTGNLLAALSGRPSRFITLTVRSSTSPLKAQLHRLLAAFRRLRKMPVWSTAVRGGCAVIEVTRNDTTGLYHPHLHCLTEGVYFPIPMLRAAWELSTRDSYEVAIRYVANNNAAVHELAKYMSKPLHHRLYLEPDVLDEAIEALHGQKQLITFGTWRRFKLTAVLREDGWRCVGHWHEAESAANDELRRLQPLIDAIRAAPKFALTGEFTATDYSVCIDDTS